MKILETIERDEIILLDETHESLFEAGRLDLRATESLAGWGAVGCLGMWIVLLLTLFGGVAFGIFTQREFNLRGIVTEATITDCFPTAQGPEIVYNYTVDSQTYSGAEINADITCASYPVGATIDIRYLPDAPDESRWRTAPNLLPVLCILGFGVLFGVPFVVGRSITTYRGFRRRQCIDKLESAGFVKRGEIIAADALSRRVGYQVITHTGETITGETRITREQRLPRLHSPVVVVYADADCHRVL